MEGYGDSREMVITGWGKVIITVLYIKEVIILGCKSKITSSQIKTHIEVESIDGARYQFDCGECMVCNGESQ